MDKSIAKGLHDRLYDKRKAAALELEKVIKQCLAEGNSPKIREIINDLCCGYAYAVHQPNARNGGLIGLAAAAIALGQNEVANYLEDIIHPVLACFGDQDARVRYYACEALYNISKVAKGEVLLYFNEIFDVLCKLSSDSEMSVKKGADLLDRLIKDIVAEKAATYVSVLQTRDPTELLKNNTIVDSDGKTLQINEPQEPTAFNLQKFIPLLTERIFVINPFTRMFLVSWIKLLDSIPDLELVSYLPTFLGGLISFLSDTHKDVRVVTHNLLDLFLHEIRRISEIKEFVEERDKQLELKRKNHENGSEPTNNSLENVSKKIQDEETNDNVYEDPDDTSTSEGALYIPGQDVVLDYPRIIDILISHLDSSEEEIQLVVLSWIETLLEISSQSFLDYIPKLLMVLLQTMANESEQLRENSKLVNNHLMELVLNLDEEQDKRLNYSPIINTLILHFTNEKPITRVASIDWLTMLHNKNPKQLLEHGDNTFLTLLKALSDQSEEVINKDLQLLSKISNESDDVYFNSFMSDLLTLFKNDRKLLETRGSFIIRTMCISLNPERIFKSLAEVLEEEKDLNFVSIIIQILNNNLLTAPELNKLRKKLTSLTTSDSVSNNEGWITFSTLFKSWCHNPAAALSLCLISQNYQLAYNILTELVEYEITINLLVQLDILIQLLESPVFTKLRLQLLEAEKYPYLYKCLYGILMLLPQSLAFKTLQNRLNSVGPIANISHIFPTSTPDDKKSSSNIEADSTFVNEQNSLLEHFKNTQIRHDAFKNNVLDNVDRKFESTSKIKQNYRTSLSKNLTKSLQSLNSNDASGSSEATRIANFNTSNHGLDNTKGTPYTYGIDNGLGETSSNRTSAGSPVSFADKKNHKSDNIVRKLSGRSFGIKGFGSDHRT